MLRPSFATPALVLALAAGPCVASAAPAPSPTPIAVPTLPPNTPNGPWVQTGINILKGLYQNEQARNRNTARGTVTYFKRYDLQLQTGPNQYRNVRLHQGTIINPRGGTPAVGRVVEVNGVADSNGTIDANQITIDK